MNLMRREFMVSFNLNPKWSMLMLLFFFQFAAFTAMAQEKKSVRISGVIFDEDSSHRALPDVAVFNKSKRSGTISNERGEFFMEIERMDTLVFSTVQHMDEQFFFIETEPFEDRVISISMKMDTVWLNVITVMGNGNYEAFKRELLAMELPDNDHSMVLPVVNKYAEEYSTGEAGIKIHGPLTYLSNKIRAWKKRGVQSAEE
jgi:hypothetical protein